MVSVAPKCGTPEGMEVPSKHPWLIQRKNVWYLRAKVPADILAVFPGAEVKRSLRTQDRSKALRLINREAAVVEQLFADYRTYRGPPPKPIIRRQAKSQPIRYNGVGSPPDDLASPASLSDADVNRLVHIRWQQWLSWIAEPVMHFSSEEREDRAHQMEVDASGPGSDDDRWSALVKAASHSLEEAGFYFDISAGQAIKLGEQLLACEAEAHRRRASRLRCSPYDTQNIDFLEPRPSTFHELPRTTFVDKASKSLNQVIQIYEEDPDRANIVAKTRTEDKRTFAYLREVVGGETPIQSVGRSQCQAFRDLICALPKNARNVCRGLSGKEAAQKAKIDNLVKLSAKGANKYIHKLSALMTYAIAKDLFVGSNPALKMALAQQHTIDDRDPFTSAQLTKIFGSEVFAANASKRHKVGEGASFWVPMLALFMGLRQGEACQLFASDFEAEKGLLYVKIQGGHGRRLKTPQARRTVPCHPVLLKFGLAEFIERTRLRPC